VNMNMRHFKSDYSHTYAVAGYYFPDGLCHFFGKYNKTGKCIVVKVEEIVGFRFGNHQCVPFTQGVDVKEGKKPLIFSNLVARDLASYDSCKNRGHADNSDYNETERISKDMIPEGTLISTRSPTFFPMSPMAMGELTAIFPSFRFASLSGTS